jgi:hypothetical protein
MQWNNHDYAIYQHTTTLKEHTKNAKRQKYNATRKNVNQDCRILNTWGVSICLGATSQHFMPPLH